MIFRDGFSNKIVVSSWRKRVVIGLLLFFGVLAQGGFSATSWALDVWDGTTGDNTYAGGTGTSTDPFQIATGEQLAYFGAMVNSGNNYSTYYFDLTDDLDLRGSTQKWTPIGIYASISSQARPFSGHFDGGGHTISNMTITSTEDNVGLFGYVTDAAIENLTLKNVDVTGNNRVGALVGYSRYSTMISHCISSGRVRGNTSVGGLVGVHYGGSGVISSSMAEGTVSGERAVGGLVGSGGYIENSSTLTFVTGNQGVGGIIGLIGIPQSVASGGYVSNSMASGVSEGTRYVGGIVGDMHASNSTSSSNVSTGRVTGSQNTGPLYGIDT